MGETTHQIEAHIEHTRDDLGSNLNELEQKVKSVTDWRQHLRNNPMTMLGVAFGGGIVLATMLGPRKNSRGYRRLTNYATGAEPLMEPDHQKNKALETWDNIKGALVGVAATRFKNFVGEVVPGFHEQFQRTDEKTKAIQAPAR